MLNLKLREGKTYSICVQAPATGRKKLAPTASSLMKISEGTALVLAVVDRRGSSPRLGKNRAGSESMASSSLAEEGAWVPPSSEKFRLVETPRKVQIFRINI